MEAILLALLWLDAADLQTKDIYDLPEGTYHVWIWSRTDAESTVRVQDQSWTVAPDEEAGYGWTQAGQFHAPGGEVAISAAGDVAAVVLSALDDFSPRDALHHRRVYDQPLDIPDQRPERYRDTNTVFTLPEYRSLEKWEEFAESLRRRILISSGLLPHFEHTPLNARVYDEVEHEDYIVAKAHFEAWPGFLVTGNLYRPKGEGPFPALVNPHGHWAEGRLEDSERGSVPGRCITFARMGIVSFAYDMVGYQDSRQLPHGNYDKHEALWGHHPFAVQLWSSIRAVDFLESLDYVDPANIGCTGASGGGTQTFALTAVEPRIKVAAPVNMISSTMQGGCVCENAPLLRLNNSNMEIGALAAPRPMLMVSATGDWTRETPWVEYPAVRSIYTLYGVPHLVSNVHVDAPHNYNRDSREAVYRFMGEHLLGEGQRYASFTEPAYERGPAETYRLFPEGAPEGYPGRERLVRQIIDATQAKWEAVLPDAQAEVAPFRDTYGPALADVLAARAPDAGELVPERTRRLVFDNYTLEKWLLHRPAAGEAVPALLYRPLDIEPVDAVLLVHGQGKAALAGDAGAGPGALTLRLLESGRAVMLIDPFLTGEYHGATGRRVRREDAYPDTFLPTNTAYRVQDILTAAAYLRFRRDLTGAVDLAGLEEAGVWAALAAALDPGIRRVAVDANGFDPTRDADWAERHYVPCIRAIGDLRTAAFLAAPRPLTVLNGDAAWRNVFEPAYRLLAPGAFEVREGPAAPDQVAEALLGS